MGEKDYVEYAFTLILTILGISSSFLVNFSNKASIVFLVFLPILYGHTAYISSTGFNRASLVSLIALIFSIMGGFTAVMSILYGVGNVLVSIFAGGRRARDYYSSVSMPLLLSGLLIGVSIFTYGSFNQQFKQQSVESISEDMAKLSETTLENTRIAEIQRRNQLRFVNRTSRSAVILTAEKITNESDPSSGVRTVLEDAKDDVPAEMYQRTLEKIREEDPRTRERVKNTLEGAIGSNFFMIIPITAFFLITIQPILGLSTAASAKLFYKLFS